MSYQGSLALNMTAAPGRPRQAPEERPELEVVTGGGLDARAREGMSAEFVRAVVGAVMAVTLFLVVGVARVTITSSTVTLLRDNTTMRSQITQIESENDGLRVVRSSLSSTTRIVSIATETYGMVSADDVETLSLDATGAPAAE